MYSKLCATSRQRIHNRLPLGLCSLLYCQFTTIISTCWADSVIDVVSATVWAECQCWHFSFVMSTTFRGSGVRLSSFWMCHILFLFISYFSFYLLRSSLPYEPRRTVHSSMRHLKYYISSSSSNVVQRWSWRSASISELQPPSW